MHFVHSAEQTPTVFKGKPRQESYPELRSRLVGEDRRGRHSRANKRQQHRRHPTAECGRPHVTDRRLRGLAEATGGSQYNAAAHRLVLSICIIDEGLADTSRTIISWKPSWLEMNIETVRLAIVESSRTTSPVDQWTWAKRFIYWRPYSGKCHVAFGVEESWQLRLNRWLDKAANQTANDWCQERMRYALLHAHAESGGRLVTVVDCLFLRTDCRFEPRPRERVSCNPISFMKQAMPQPARSQEREAPPRSAVVELHISCGLRSHKLKISSEFTLWRRVSQSVLAPRHPGAGRLTIEEAPAIVTLSAFKSGPTDPAADKRHERGGTPHGWQMWWKAPPSLHGPEAGPPDDQKPTCCLAQRSDRTPVAQPQQWVSQGERSPRWSLMDWNPGSQAAGDAGWGQEEGVGCVASRGRRNEPFSHSNPSFIPQRSSCRTAPELSPDARLFWTHSMNHGTIKPRRKFRESTGLRLTSREVKSYRHFGRQRNEYYRNGCMYTAIEPEDPVKRVRHLEISCCVPQWVLPHITRWKWRVNLLCLYFERGYHTTHW